MNTIPTETLILGCQNFFNQDPPKDRLQILFGICKHNLIVEFAGLNYRLKPNDSIYYDVTFQTQVKELRYFCGLNVELFHQILKILNKFRKSMSVKSLIFTRQTCLYALEEIIQSDMPVIENFDMSKIEVRESILKYIFSVNTAITEFDNDIEEEVNVESLNSKLLPLNELGLEIDPFFIPYRAYFLFQFLQANHKIKDHFCEYINTAFGMNFEKYIYEVLRMKFANNHNNPSHNFFYNKIELKDIRLFEELSKRFHTKEIFKILSLRKYPFFKLKDDQFILTDNNLLLDKLYSQFINDFWFDKLRNDPNWNVLNYKSIIGYFIESYVKGLINYSFKNAKHFVVKQFDELKINNARKPVEISDLYIRFNTKILLAEVKSTSLYDNAKYSGNLNEFYRSNREQFFHLFGVDQLVKSIKTLHDTIKIVDHKFPENKALKIFPIIIFTEKALQTPLMAKIFQERFLELMNDFNNKKIYIYPLSMVHISDLETIQDFLNLNSKEIWGLLKFHCRNPKFMPPFYSSILGKEIKPKHKQTMELYNKLCSKFSE